MKKILKIVSLLLVLAIALCSCGEKKSEEFSYGSIYDDNGYFKNIKASEYVTVPDLSSIEVSKADIEEEIAYFLSSYPDQKQVMDRAVVDNDKVNIDYVGKIDGVAFDGGSTDGAGTTVTIGVTNYIDGFLEQLIGHFPGETFDINVTFPDEYSPNPDLAGKPAVFTITLNCIVENTLPTWNDDFVYEKLSSYYGWETAAQAEAGIASWIAEDTVMEKSAFLQDIPEDIIKYLTDAQLAYYKRYAEAYNMVLDSFLQYYTGYENEAAFREGYKSSATTDAKYYLIYQAIAEKNGTVISEEDISKYFKDMDGTEDWSEYKDFFGVPYIKATIMYESMSKLIADSAKVK
ncbi:MAG: FKBP-type peptidyl-prolyl cis-trans isomerase [Firmicutes bacterium]|nr:FKBP-type peptidyl-prolyl cis-trans isomerase [Bacillota bacterium]